MKKDRKWKRFEKSGSVKDYLEYACTSEHPMTESELDYVFDSTIGHDDRHDISIADMYSADDMSADDDYRSGWDERIEIY